MCQCLWRVYRPKRRHLGKVVGPGIVFVPGGLYPVTESTHVSWWLTSQDCEQRGFDAKPDLGPFLSTASVVPKCLSFCLG